MPAPSTRTSTAPAAKSRTGSRSSSSTSSPIAPRPPPCGPPLRLWFASFAYVLLDALRRIGLRHTQFAAATCGTIRLKLLKIGAPVRKSVRRVNIAMASACPYQTEYHLAYLYLQRTTAFYHAGIRSAARITGRSRTTRIRLALRLHPHLGIAAGRYRGQVTSHLARCMPAPKLAVIILTLDEERNLPHALGSLRGLDAEVFVVDSGSTDRTVEIARAAGCQVALHPFENYALQRNWAFDHLPIGTPVDALPRRRRAADPGARGGDQRRAPSGHPL